MLLEKTEKYAVESEAAAHALIAKLRSDAEAERHTVKKTGVDYKIKKAKGEIIGEKWVVTVITTIAGLWDDFE